MNATAHSQLSVRNRGGEISDWYPLHDLMDRSKEVESSNAHRLAFHHLWGIKQVIIPIFGHTLKLTGGGTANVKDAMEADHVMADFGNRFLPTFADYIACVEDDSGDTELIRQFDFENRKFYKEYPKIREHMLSPLAVTGAVKSLLLTHSSWWLNTVLPHLFKGIKIEIKDFNIAPAVLFNRMTFTDWMNNGRGAPPSFAKINEHRKKKSEPKPTGADMVLDGRKRPITGGTPFDEDLGPEKPIYKIPKNLIGD